MRILSYLCRNNFKRMKQKVILSTFLFLAVSSLFHAPAACAREAILPMDIPPLLAGNFGELRSNHFHSGIDFKTNGRTGIPVKAVMDGFISRIFISPYGFGRALYVDHPDGTTTVYGHLERFSKAVESLAVDSQYVRQSFFADLYLPSGRFPVKQGDVIAYSGNTGGSSGPHLHFEWRETASQRVMDPLMLYPEKIRDTVKPRILSLMIYPQKGAGAVNGRTAKQAIAIRKDRKTAGISISPEIKVWGKAGFAVKAYDYMDGTQNTCGVKDITLKIDGSTVFHSRMDGFAFSETRYLNSFIDWEEWTYRKSFYIKAFVEPGNLFPSYDMKGNGIFDFREERPYKIACILKDAAGNTETFSFTVQGRKQPVPPRRPDGIPFSADRDNAFDRDGASLRIPAGNLYADIDFKYAVTNGYTAFSPLYGLHERWPLHSWCPLTVDIRHDTFPDKEKYGIVSVCNGKQQWIGGDYSQGKITARIRELGAFSVTVDTIPPTVKAIRPEAWSKTRKIAFHVADDLSGIASWTASVDGRFVLFELDGKSGRLSCPLDARNMKRGRCILTLTVCDTCGNKNTQQLTVNN
jgi:hypothetical protein